jgi:NAD(P)-dependent dehydrogenase (short-subunit alcohol dehydrogenase family)
MNLQGQTAIVTGAGRGIGRAIALALAAEGMKLVLVSRTDTELEEVVAAVTARGGLARPFTCDVRDHQAVEACFKELQRAGDSLDLLVNNAGSFRCLGPVWETDADDWLGDLQVAVHGTYFFSRSALQLMVSRRKGRIVNLIGGGTSTPIPFGSSYSVAKTAVMRFTECAAAETLEYGVRIFALQPGLVVTRLTTQLSDSEAGRRWRPQLREWLRGGQAVPPENAGRQVVCIAKGLFDAFSGRALDENDDFQTVNSQVEEIGRKDLRTLRMR